MVLKVLLILIALILNIMGIYAICNCKSTLYSFLLVNLSATEILILLHQIIEIIAMQVCQDLYPRSIVSNIVMTLYLTGEWEFFATMTIILISRALATIYPIQYMIYNSSPSKVKNFLLATWLFSITYGLAFNVLTYHHVIKPNFIFIYFVVLYSLYTLFTLINYIIIAIKTRQSQQNVNSANSRINTYSEKLYQMSTLLVVTFIIFNAIPTCLWLYPQQLERYTIFLNHIGYILDPLIYTYLNHKYRSVIASIFKRTRNNTRHVTRSDKKGIVNRKTNEMIYLHVCNNEEMHHGKYQTQGQIQKDVFVVFKTSCTG